MKYNYLMKFETNNSNIVKLDSVKLVLGDDFIKLVITR